MIETILSDRGSALWPRVRRRVAGSEACLVVAGRMAVMEQVRARGATVIGEPGILSINDLFGVVEAALEPSLRPPSASDRLVRLAALERLLADPELEMCDELRRCRAPADREVLLSWIDRVAARADREHADAAATPVERGVERLRQSLDDLGLVSEPRRRAELARHSGGADLGVRLVVGPAPLADPFASGLLKGLARGHDVQVHGLTCSSLADAWLSEGRLGPEWEGEPHTGEFDRRDIVGALYSGGRADGSVELLEAGDELPEALVHVRTLLEEGIPARQITLALARPERDFIRLEQLAARAEVPILARSAVAADQTPVGRLALAACRPGLCAEDLTRPGAAVGLQGPQAAAISEASGLERTRLLLTVLGELAERPDLPTEVRARELNWVDALAVELQVAQSIVPPPSCAEIVAGARTRSLLVGDPDGVAVVGYSEVQGLERTHLVATGLSEGRWPPRDTPSPFISPPTLAACPGLAPVDRRVDFVAALASAEQTLLVREARDGAGRDRAPSILYAAATSAGAGAIAPLRTPPPRGRARAATTRGDELRRVARDKENFSVSELSQYLACPRGWEVKYGLGLAGRESPAAVLGRLAHRMLQAAFGEGAGSVEDRVARAAEALAGEPDRAGIDPPTRAVLDAMVAGLVRDLSPPTWLGTPIAVEDTLPPLRFEPAGATISAQVDRIDRLPDGQLLVIDYKQGRRPAWRHGSVLARDMQACLYPQMVAHHRGGTVLGTIFVSVRHGGFDGLVRRLAPGIDAPFLHVDADLLADSARENLIGAIEGIRAGRFEGEAPGCWAGCPCRLRRDLVGGR